MVNIAVEMRHSMIASLVLNTAPDGLPRDARHIQSTSGRVFLEANSSLVSPARTQIVSTRFLLGSCFDQNTRYVPTEM